MKVGIAAAVCIGALVFLYGGSKKEEPGATATVSRAPDRPFEEERAPIIPPVLKEAATALEPVPAADQAGLSPDDIAFLEKIIKLLNASPAPIEESDLKRLESILAAQSDTGTIRKMAVECNLRKTVRAVGDRKFAEASSIVDHVKGIDPQEPRAYEVDVSLKIAVSDWNGAEQAAHTYESMFGEKSVQVEYGLAFAVSRLDRVEEALAILDRNAFSACSTGGSSQELTVVCPQARDLKAQLGRLRNARAGKDMLQSERFAVRFDGETQNGVARDVLFVLDRAYVRLAEIYNHRPATKIPVILHSNDDYYSKTGAPRWSGGQYSSHDGNIQIPVRGLQSSMPRDMEDVLVHELSHAFVDDMTGGELPRDLNEGLAQYMEGRRYEKEVDAAELKRLLTSRSGDVGSFYAASLMIAQHIVQQNGQGAVNNLLLAMRETGSADGGFEKVLGKTYATIKKEILDTLRRRYS